jgi:hypothetical protein
MSKDDQELTSSYTTTLGWRKFPPPAINIKVPVDRISTGLDLFEKKEIKVPVSK